MHYEKLTVERFAQNLKDGKYAGLTGARRSIGKTDWTTPDREHAHELANKHFAKEGAASKGKTPKPAKTAAAKKPKVAATKAAAKAPKTETVAKPAKPAKQPAAKKSTPPPAPASRPTFAKVVREPVIAVAPSLLRDDATTVRQNSTGLVIAALSGRKLNALEQRTYELAHASFAKNTAEELAAVSTTSDPKPATVARVLRTPSSASKTAAAAASEPTSESSAEPEPSPALTPREVIASPGIAPRIPVATALGATSPVVPPRIQTNEVNDAPVELTPEELAQHERLVKAARAAGLPIPGQPSAS
jgi:hypothetical protein